jgi:hypothetical protein
MGLVEGPSVLLAAQAVWHLGIQMCMPQGPEVPLPVPPEDSVAGMATGKWQTSKGKAHG